MGKNIEKYKLSNMEKFLILVQNYEFGIPIMETINFAKYHAIDEFASNIVASNKKDFSEGQAFLFTLLIDSSTEVQLKKYLLSKKNFILKYISRRGYYSGTHIYQLYLQYLLENLSDEEKNIFLENYIEMVEDLRGKCVANEKKKCLEKNLGIEYIKNKK